MLYSLRWRLLLSFVLVIAVVLGMAAYFVSRASSAELERLQDRNKAQQMERLYNLLAKEYARSQGWQDVQDALVRVAELYDQRVIIHDQRGVVVADSRITLLGRVLSGPLESERELPVIGPRGNVGIMLINPNPLPGEPEVPESESNLPSINRFLIWSGLLAGAVAVAFTFFLSRRILSPVESLSRAAKAMARGDFSRKVPVDSKDEVGELARTFNAMSEELAKTEQVRRSLVADVAHELRTPLTNIQVYVEAMRDGFMQADSAALDSIHEEVLILTRLIEDLQELALAESGHLTLHVQTCNMADLVLKAVTAIQPRADAKGIRIHVGGSEDVAVQADPDRIGQALRNLLVNAVNYTPPGGATKVEIVREKYEVAVNVEDTGPGIADEELAQVFDRFYRVDKSRSRATGGVGLGLTIAKRLVEAHGGSIFARSQVGQGSTFTMVLPLVRVEESGDSTP